MPFYFAYGSNMDIHAMAARCPQARLVGRARLPRHRVALMRDGYATLVRDPHATAQGALWEITFADLAALDTYEGDGYLKITQPVLREGARPIRALVYIGKAAVSSGKAPPDYMASVLIAALEIGLPADYINELRLLAGEAPKATSRFRAIKRPDLIQDF
jgi:hypothetical protein